MSLDKAIKEIVELEFKLDSKRVKDSSDIQYFLQSAELNGVQTCLRILRRYLPTEVDNTGLVKLITKEEMRLLSVSALISAKESKAPIWQNAFSCLAMAASHVALLLSEEERAMREKAEDMCPDR